MSLTFTRTFRTALLSLTILALVLSGCVSVGATYWTPPHAAPTMPPELTFLSENPLEVVASPTAPAGAAAIAASPTLTPTITLAIKDLPTPQGAPPGDARIYRHAAGRK